MSNYKITYYVGFSKAIDFEPVNFCNKIAELFDCNIHYTLDTDDENCSKPIIKNYDFGKRITFSVEHGIYYDNETYDKNGVYINKYPGINYCVNMDNLFNSNFYAIMDKSGLIELYIDEIFWKSLSLSYNDSIDEYMKTILIKNRSVALFILQKLGCTEALILPDCLAYYVDSFMDKAVEADCPITSFEEMKTKLQKDEHMHYYNVENLLRGNETVDKVTQSFQTGFHDTFNSV